MLKITSSISNFPFNSGFQLPSCRKIYHLQNKSKDWEYIVVCFLQMGFNKMYILSLCPWNFTYTVLFSSFLLKWSFNWLYSRVTVIFSQSFQDIISQSSAYLVYIFRGFKILSIMENYESNYFEYCLPESFQYHLLKLRKYSIGSLFFLFLICWHFIYLKSFSATISMHSFLGYFCFLSLDRSTQCFSVS